MEVSTPFRQNLRRRSLLNVSAVSSPLRKSTVGGADVSLLEPADDEKERTNRRSMVAMQRRLTNITSSSMSPLVDSNPIIDESQIKDHLRICTKLYTENRISAKNAWQLHVIDVMRKIASTDNANVLQVAGSSLDIGAKVYGLRVDDVHAKGLQLASSMAKSNEKQTNEENEEDGNTSLDQQQRKRSAKKKTKKLAADKRNVVIKEEKNLYGSIKHVESVVFSTKENIDVSATDNLFTHKLPTNPASHQFMLLYVFIQKYLV
jgi:condensin complex subunit 2